MLAFKKHDIEWSEMVQYYFKRYGTSSLSRMIPPGSFP